MVEQDSTVSKMWVRVPLSPVTFCALSLQFETDGTGDGHCR